ncbi:MAG: PaaI family thioesterase [Actinomycetaceae bacterium]|nr:PaaI family thioesterase [Actinomycetaceae bacterium]
MAQGITREDAHSASLGALADKMGISVIELGPRRSVMSMPVEGNTQSAGILHGGATAVLGETTGSFAGLTAAPEGMVALGLDITVKHHRGVAAGDTLTCEAVCRHVGRSMATYDLLFRNGAGEITASGSHTVVFRPAPHSSKGPTVGAE